MTKTITLESDQALVTSQAVAMEAIRDCENLAQQLNDSMECDISSMDAQASAVLLRKSLDALDAIGWPHEHRETGTDPANAGGRTAVSAQRTEGVA